MSGKQIPDEYVYGLYDDCGKVSPFVVCSQDLVPKTAFQVRKTSGMQTAWENAWKMLKGYQGPRSEPRPMEPKYWYGVTRLAKKLVPFVTKLKEKIPEEAVIVHEESISSTMAWSKASKLCDEVKRDFFRIVSDMSPDPDPDSLVPGRLALFDDGDAHNAVILQVRRDECLAVFLTTKPNWAKSVRRATKEEITMFGVKKTKDTWLAGVIRPVSPFISRQKMLPQSKTEELTAEFCHLWEEDVTT